jgi:hypothetical protein
VDREREGSFGEIGKLTLHFPHLFGDEEETMERKKILISLLVGVIAVGVWVHPVAATELLIFDRPLNILGYVTQEVGFGLNDKDYYDTEKGLQTVLSNLFVEGDYKISNQLKFYASTRITADWIYQIKANDSSWHEKQFDKSANELNFDHEYWKILREAHVTYSPEKFFIRVGKQIITWGDMLGIRLIDQINPLDSRRALGLNDIEFDYTPIPIWLIRSEYHPGISTKWLQDLGFEFVFNPHADKINDQGTPLGNTDAGIWAPNIRIPATNHPLFRIGSALSDIDEPGRFNSKAYEYAFRVKGVLWDTMVTLNAFYGRENSPIVKLAPPGFIVDPRHPTATDGSVILHPVFTGHFPLFRFVGATASRDIPFLAAPFLGNVAPIFRFETWYAFKNTFTDALSTFNSQNRFKKFDEFRAAVSIDWKIKIPLLNPRANFYINPQVYYRNVGGFRALHPYKYGESPEGLPQPDWFDTALTRVGRHNWLATLYIDTVYLNAKLRPSIFWIHDFTFNGDYLLPQVMYDWSSNWRFTLGALIFTGKKLPGWENGSFKSNNGFELFKHKNQIFFRVAYRWG